MGSTSTKHDDEWLAAGVLRAVLNAQVETHDDGSHQSMYDLTLTYADGRPSAVAEVVSTRDQAEILQLDAVGKLGYVREPSLAKSWWVQVAPAARIKRLRAEIVPVLRNFERQGIGRVSWSNFGPAREQLRALLVDGCWSGEATEQNPPGFRLSLRPKGAWGGDGETVVRQAEDFLRTVPDVPAKLLSSGAAERHAVVIVTVDRLKFFAALEQGHILTAPPDLPDGIDRLWLVPMKVPPYQIAYWDGTSWLAPIVTAEDLGIQV